MEVLIDNYSVYDWTALVKVSAAAGVGSQTTLDFDSRVKVTMLNTQ